MASTGKYLASLPGILKIINIVFGAITIGCAANASNLDYHFEEYFYGAAIACFIASVAFYPIFVSASSDGNKALKHIDFLYHVILGIVLIVAASMQLQSAVKHKSSSAPPGFTPTEDEKNFDRKVAAGSFGLINGLVYFGAALAVIANREDEMSFRNYPKSPS